MGRFHRHADGTVHTHDHSDNDHSAAGYDHAHSAPVGHDQSAEHVAHSGHQPGHGAGLGDHSGYQSGQQRIEVLERIFDENDRRAAANRALFSAHGVLALNVMSSPGAGKTTVLERTLGALPTAQLPAPQRFGIIEGDIATSLDADRLSGFGAQLSLLNTGNGFGGECHLDAPMVANALGRLDLRELDLVFIENVGNLVCPAEFDVGASHNVMIYAITEGEEKPLKYPVMFRAADVVLINKIDLLPYLDFDLELFAANLRRVNPTATVLRLSARTADGLADWLAWLGSALSGQLTSRGE
jgi:hydrogenase nickel incorporation protein HypB